MAWSLISYRHVRKWCAKCRYETLQRYATGRPAVVVALSLITCGGYLVAWLLGRILPRATTCTRCGTLNPPPPCAFSDQQWGDQPNQYANGRAKPPT